jgi:hypothetical protein
MRRFALLAFMVLSLFSTLTSYSAKGQTTHDIQVKIPFDFFVIGEKFVAGQYTIGRVNASSPNELLLKGGPSGRSKIVLTQRVEARELTRQSAWIFTRYRDQYFLSEIWEVGQSNGRRVPSSGYESQLRRRRGERSIVRFVGEPRRN